MKTIVTTTLLAVLGAAAGVLAQGPLDPPPGTPGPTQKSLQEIWDELQNVKDVATNQQAQLAALQQQNTVLLNLLGSGLAWVITTVDTVGDVDGGASETKASLAFGPDGHPAVAYYEYDRGDLKFASFDGSDWSVESVETRDDVGAYASLAFAPDGEPAIAYYDATNHTLKFARYNRFLRDWVTTTVDSQSRDVGTHASLAFGPDGQPSIAYYDPHNEALKFARFFGGTWTATEVDGTGNVGQYASLAFGPDDQPAIAYYDEDSANLNLKFARFDGGVWSTETVDNGGANDVGRFASLAFGPNGQPAIAYLDDTTLHLKFARLGAGWKKWSAGVGGYFASLAFGPDGQPAIVHVPRFPHPLQLLYTRFNGTDWGSVVIEDIEGNGIYASFAFGPNGQPAAAYVVNGSNNLRFARRGVFQSSP